MNMDFADILCSVALIVSLIGLLFLVVLKLDD